MILMPQIFSNQYGVHRSLLCKYKTDPYETETVIGTIVEYFETHIRPQFFFTSHD